MDFYIILYFAIFVVSYILMTQLIHKMKNLPPSPFSRLPILGHAHLLFKNPKIIHRTFAKISEKYGPVVYLKVGSRPTVLISSASAAKECFITNDVAFANRPHFIVTDLGGYEKDNVGWVSYGPVWKSHRKIASTEILSNQRLNQSSKTRDEEVKLLMKRIYEARGDESVEIGRFFMELTANTMMRTIGGKSIYKGDHEVESCEAKKFDKMNKALYDGLYCVADFFPFFKYLGLHKLAENKLKGSIALLEECIQDLVDDQKGKVMEHVENGIAHKNRNFIQALLHLNKTNPLYSAEHTIKSLAQILLVGGSDTSFTTLEWALALLLKNPQVVKRAKEEIDAHIGDTRHLSEDDLGHLPYLNCIIKETLRMYPTIPLLVPHESSSECMVAGYNIPRGTMLYMNLWAIHNDPTIWEEPLKYKPERFESKEDADKIKAHFFPFGIGRRACPGENLAMRFIGLTLGSLLQCFDFEMAGDIDMAERVGVAMYKENPLLAKFTPRKQFFELMSSHI